VKKHALGIDIGGTSIKIGLFSSEGELLDKWQIPTRTEQNGRYILEDTSASLETEMKKRHISKEDVVGIGIGIPGPVINHSTAAACTNLHWGEVKVADEIKKLTGVSNVIVENDANVAALGEMWTGSCKGCRSVAMITIGTGIGGGFVLDGKILSGRCGVAGELGHMQVCTDEERICSCGKRGHLEQYAAAPGILWKTRKLLKETDKESVLREIEDLSIKHVFDAAKENDELALEVVDFVGEMIGRTMSYISMIVDPDVFVIGGGVSNAGDILIDSITKHFKDIVAFPSSGEAEIRLATLGNDAGIYGAVKMILE
jgi:glucokinase